MSIVLSHPKMVIAHNFCNQFHATVLLCRIRGGTLKKYPRQVEAKNRQDLAHYYSRFSRVVFL